MDENRYIFFERDLSSLGTEKTGGQLAHMYCTGGSCEMDFNNSTFVISKGDCAIVRATQLITAMRPSPDFSVMILYASPVFIEKATPNNNYGIRGSLSLFQDPVMHLNEQEQIDCERDFFAMERRLSETDHNFYGEVLLAVMQVLILDFFHFHVRIHGKDEVPSQSSSIMGRFIAMLDRGDYRQNREVSYYASALCVAPKYLSEVSKTVSGFSASWWINRFTILDISRELRDRSLDFNVIADQFNFSSPAYFSRYVQRYLGASPTEYRG